MVTQLSDNAARHGFRLFGLDDPAQGIVHVVGPEQGLTLPGLIRRLKVGTDWSLHDEQQHARRALGEAAALAIDDYARRHGISAELAERIRIEFADKAAHALPDAAAKSREANFAKSLRQAALRAERDELIRIGRENQISDAVLHHLEEDLDYQEAHV